jgi:hypothetical protein
MSADTPSTPAPSVPAAPSELSVPAEITRRGAGFWVSAAIGAAVIAFGLRGLFTHHIDTRPPNLAKFFIGGVIIHDAVFAPIVLAGGVLLARLVRGRARAYVQAVLIIVGCMALFAFPEIRDYARINHNPTSLPFNYTANAAAVALAVAVAAAVTATGRAVLRRRAKPGGPTADPVREVKTG